MTEPAVIVTMTIEVKMTPDSQINEMAEWEKMVLSKAKLIDRKIKLA